MDLMPCWVEPDPLRGRALDALGLQATADRIADVLLPGLSVLTTRARYFTFLAWARAACGSSHDETRVHRLEVALAIREALLSISDPDHRDCRYVGSRSLARVPFDTVPRDPKRVYRVPAWRGYRASMVNLGLIDKNDRLTDVGTTAARAFGAASRGDSSGRSMLPKSACLQNCSPNERRVLIGQLGVMRRGRPSTDDDDASRRDALWREISDDFDTSTGFWAANILDDYEAVRARSPSPTVLALREAAIWERVSFGLNTVFLAWLQAVELGGREPARLKQRVKAARQRRRQAPPDLVDLDRSSLSEDRDKALAFAFTSLRAALLVRERVGVDATPRSEPGVFELARSVVGSAPLDTVLRQLEDRHLGVKADDAWIRRRDGVRVELARDSGSDKWELPRRVRLHPYRLWAFGQIMVDLWRAR